MRIPLLEIGPSGVMLSTVRKRYLAYRSTGLSVQQATRETEKELGISDVRTSSDGKDVVFFKEDAFTDALSKFTGMQFDACPVCKELLAHRGGKALPCHNPKCPAKGKPVNETWYSSAFDRGEAEKDWIDAHPGFQFGVYAGRTLLSTHPSIPAARREARKHTGKGKDIRIKDVKHPDRSYWHEEVDLKEAASPHDDLIAALQAALGDSSIKSVWDASPRIDWHDLKFQFGIARKLKEKNVYVKLKDGHVFILPYEMAEALIANKNSNMRSLKKYVAKRW